MNKTFYMVKGNGPTRFIHSSYQGAVEEARRLAEANPGEEFHVLKTLGSFKAPPPVKPLAVWTHSQS